MKKQLVEGLLNGCQKESCISGGCCDDDRVEEWANEYFAFHERIKEHLVSLGIQITFAGDRVQFRHCSDGRNCKFLTHSLNRDIDPRPIDCKIYPFAVDWRNIDFDDKIVRLRYWESNPKDYCPLVKKNAIPESFKKEVEKIIKRDFALLFYGAQFKIEFVNNARKPKNNCSI